jgi:hypothetical protein
MIEPQSHARPDFDHWAALARQDPDLFEAERSLLLETTIRKAPIHLQHRLRCLQWKLDQIRKTSGSPLAAALRMNRLLWEAIAARDGLLDRLNRLQTPDNPRQPPRSSARILRIPV